MSMSEPLLPHPAQDDQGIAAAEPGGEGAPLPGSAEEPDVLPGVDEDDAAESAAAESDAAGTAPRARGRIRPSARRSPGTR